MGYNFAGTATVQLVDPTDTDRVDYEQEVGPGCAYVLVGKAVQYYKHQISRPTGAVRHRRRRRRLSSSPATDRSRSTTHAHSQHPTPTGPLRAVRPLRGGGSPAGAGDCAGGGDRVSWCFDCAREGGGSGGGWVLFQYELVWWCCVFLGGWWCFDWRRTGQKRTQRRSNAQMRLLDRSTGRSVDSVDCEGTAGSAPAFPFTSPVRYWRT